MSSPRVVAAGAAAPAAVLRAERLQRRALDEAVARDASPPSGRARSGSRRPGRRRASTIVGHAAARRSRRAPAAVPRASPPCAADATAEDVQQLADPRRDLGQSPPGSSRAPARSGAAAADSRMPRACSSVSRTVPSGVMTLPARRSAPAARRTSPAGQSRSISAARAAAASGLARISRITSSMLATAMARPTSRCARSRALPSSKRGAAQDHLLAEAR